MLLSSNSCASVRRAALQWLEWRQEASERPCRRPKPHPARRGGMLSAQLACTPVDMTDNMSAVAVAELLCDCDGAPNTLLPRALARVNGLPLEAVTGQIAAMPCPACSHPLSDHQSTATAGEQAASSARWAPV